MRRVLRATVALVAVAGLLATTALGAATAVHVALEHEASGPSEHAHHGPQASHEDHAHPHPPAAVAADHPHGQQGELHRSPAPGHRHAPALVADGPARTARNAVGPAAAGPADAPHPLAPAVERSFLAATSRAGPVARSAPQGRRSVVLQV